MKKTRSLLVFAKEPVPGNVKTRLIPAIGENSATKLYEKLLYQTLNACSKLLSVNIILCCSRSDANNTRCQYYADYFTVVLRSQVGQDLGERMHYALNEALFESEQVILIGTDCPEYSAAYLEKAFTLLDNHDVVLGPAADGGYVLIGMKQPHQELFQEIPWSTAKVLPLTRQRLTSLGLSWAELETLNDIDEPSDLVHVQDLLNIMESENSELA